MKTYTLKEDKFTGELHLFEGETTSDSKGKCATETLSICGKMQDSDNAENVFACANDKLARHECAEIGERVCGICVSRLYASY